MIIKKSFKYLLPCMLIASAPAYSIDNLYNIELGDSGVFLSPGIDASFSHDDNIFQEENIKKSSWITEIDPFISLHSQKGQDKYELRYQALLGYFHSSHDDDYKDHLLSFSSYTELNKRNRLEISAGYNLLHERRGSGISDQIESSFDRPDKYKDALIGGKYTYGSKSATGAIEVFASYLDKEFTNHEEVNRFFDRKEPAIGAAFYYRIKPKTHLLAEIKHRINQYDYKPANEDKLDSDSTNYQLGVTWEATAKTKGILKVGKIYKNFDSSSYQDTDFTSWELTTIWSPKKYSQVKLTTSSDAQEQSGTGTYAEEQVYLAEWKHDWSDRLSSKFSLSRLDSDYKESPRNDSLDSLQLGVSYKVKPWMEFGASYNLDKRDSSLVGFDYTNTVFLFYAKIGIDTFEKIGVNKLTEYE
jgi:polysaccharide biosynthesis protein VpsM